MDELTSYILERIGEGLTITDVSEEGCADCDVYHSAGNPLIDSRKQEPQSKSVDDSSNHILGLQPILFELIDVLSELFLAGHHLSYRDDYHAC